MGDIYKQEALDPLAGKDVFCARRTFIISANKFKMTSILKFCSLFLIKFHPIVWGKKKKSIVLHLYTC